MGATIGINTMLLLGSVAFITERAISKKGVTWVRAGLNIMNVSLLIFWLSLIGAGIIRSLGIYNGEYFAVIARNLTPYLEVFSTAGVILAIGTIVTSSVFVKALLHKQAHKKTAGKHQPLYEKQSVISSEI